MEKINIAELLKDCPKGMELDCVMYNDVTLRDVDCSSYPIQVQTPEGNMNLSRYGCMSLSEHARCIIFPKGKTTWEGFVPPCKFKDGDIVTNIEGAVIIYKGITTCGYCGSFVSLDHCNQFIPHYKSYLTDTIRFATEEEKQKLFQAIKDRGYKWDSETKTLEKLIIPKFKVGDRIRSVISLSYYTIVDIKDDQYVIKPDAPEKFPYHIDFSLETNYELVHKFDITTLKPFDKVLVRDNNTMEWDISFFSHCNGLEFYKYSCLNGNGYAQCIPYEENKHLLGKTNKCAEFYMLWEE